MKKVTLIVPFNGDLDLFENNLNRFIILDDSFPEVLNFIIVVDTQKISVDHLKEIKAKKENMRLSKKLKVVVPQIKLGQMNALILGMSVSDSEAVLLMSDDRKEPNNLIAEMMHLYHEQHLSVIGSAKASNFWGKLWRSIYYTLIGIVGIKYPPAGFDSALIDPDAKKKLLERWRGEQFLQRLVIKAVGKKYVCVEYDKGQDDRAESGWTKFNKMKYLISGINESFYFAILILSFSLVFYGFAAHIYILSCISFTLLLLWNFLASSPYKKIKSVSDIPFSII